MGAEFTDAVVRPPVSSTELAARGQFPTRVRARVAIRYAVGMWITVIATAVLAVGFNLGTIASVGSPVSLAVFMRAGIGAVRQSFWVTVAWIASAAILDALEAPPRSRRGRITTAN